MDERESVCVCAQGSNSPGRSGAPGPGPLDPVEWGPAARRLSEDWERHGEFEKAVRSTAMLRFRAAGGGGGGLSLRRDQMTADRRGGSLGRSVSNCEQL